MQVCKIILVCYMYRSGLTAKTVVLGDRISHLGTLVSAAAAKLFVSQTVLAAMALHQMAVDMCINGRTSIKSHGSLADVAPWNVSSPSNPFPQDVILEGEKSYLVILKPQLKNTTEFLFGVVMKSWPESTPMASIMQYALDRYNGVWTKTMDYLLQLQLRWHSNRTILENSAERLLGKFYQQHWEDRDCMIYFTIPNKYKSYTKGSIVIALEAFINTVKFEICTGSEAMVTSQSKNIKKTSKKRPASGDSVQENKRVCVAGEIPGSSFIPRPKAGPHQLVIAPTSTVSLQWANAQYVEALDSVDIRVDSAEPIHEGELGDEAWQTGQTKKVYKLTIGSQHYVAKRMFDVGNGPEVITPCENMDFLYAEISRLKQGQYFLDKFTMQAEMMGVSTPKDIEFTQAWLASEILTETYGPSIASSVTQKDLEGLKLTNPDTHGGEKDSGIWWLIELLHVPSVDHWHWRHGKIF
ncbi:hypothetical protein K439DRAFT_1623534 [Ramaria rubella]|nr:hypothetical protein K439DRAFT_1623534 [Ramaria rubella]